MQAQPSKGLNDNTFAANDVQASAAGSMESKAGNVQGDQATKTLSAPGSTPQQEVDLQIEAVRNAANNPHAAVKDMAMQDVQ